MSEFSENSEYHTDPDKKSLTCARLATRLTFYYLVLRQVLTYRSHILKHKTWADEFATRSDEITRAAEACGGKLHITGIDYIRQVQGPVVFVGNHMSTLETFLLPGLILPSKPVTFVVKESLVRHPVFGPVMRQQDPVVVTRTNPREDLKNMLSKGSEILNNGISLVIFPQSTRLPVFEKSKFNSIGAKLAQRNNLPVIPIALKTDFWSNGRLLRDLGPVDPRQEIHIAFGAPIPAGPARDIQSQIVEFIETHLQSWNVPCTD